VQFRSRVEVSLPGRGIAPAFGWTAGPSDSRPRNASTPVTVTATGVLTPQI